MLYEDYKNLHQIPELGFKEFKTSTYIYKKLLLTKAQVNKINTGICAFFNFFKNKTIAFRCELDALKIKEENNIPFKSKHIGFMHACGHDGNMAIILNLANYINKLSSFPYNILLIFQPSEEKYKGALSIISHLNNYNIKAIFAMHFFPTLKENFIYTSKDILFASSNEIDIKAHAKSIHIGNYRKDNDAIKIVTKVANYIENKANKEKMLFHYGYIKGGNSRNVSASTCLIKGSLRSFSEEKALDFIDKYLKNNGKIKYKISPIIPPLINDDNLSSKLINALNINVINKPFYQAEDFSFYSKLFPSTFFLCGINSSFLHTSTFLLKEDNLLSGYNFYIKLLNYINKYKL